MPGCGIQRSVCWLWPTAWAATTREKSRRISPWTRCTGFSSRARRLTISRGRSTASRLFTALKIATDRVSRASETNSDYTGMGTTVVAAIADGPSVTFASIGDSRMYLLQNSELRQLTDDDSWVVMLQKESGLDPRAFDKHPMRHVLTSVVGARADVDAEVHELELVGGQTLMLCTEGLHGGLPDPMIHSILREEPDLQRAADKLVDT